MSQPPAVQSALDRLADTLGALGRYGRLPWRQAAQEAMDRPGSDRWLMEFWRCIYDLVESLDEEQEK